MHDSTKRNPARRATRAGRRRPAALTGATRKPYVRPTVEPAGSVFERTRALGDGAKDGLVGSVLL